MLVSIRRVASAGMRKPDRVTPLAGSSIETSGLTCSLMVLFGGDLRLERQPDAELAEHDRSSTRQLAPPCTTGTGNSPPTRKLASLPSLVTRFGSASICSSPWVLQRLDERRQVQVRPEGEDVQCVADC